MLTVQEYQTFTCMILSGKTGVMGNTIQIRIGQMLTVREYQTFTCMILSGKTGVMGNTIQISVVADAYCARISNLYMYDSVR